MLIKFFASGSIRDGGKMNVTQEQVDAVCGEAKAQGLRTLVHAHDPASIIASVKAGCIADRARRCSPTTRRSRR